MGCNYSSNSTSSSQSMLLGLSIPASDLSRRRNLSLVFKHIVVKSKAERYVLSLEIPNHSNAVSSVITQKSPLSSRERLVLRCEESIETISKCQLLIVNLKESFRCQ